MVELIEGMHVRAWPCHTISQRKGNTGIRIRGILNLYIVWNMVISAWYS